MTAQPCGELPFEAVSRNGIEGVNTRPAEVERALFEKHALSLRIFARTHTILWKAMPEMRGIFLKPRGLWSVL